MFNYNNINLKLLGLTMFASIGFHDSSLVSAKLSSIVNGNDSIFHIDTIDLANENEPEIINLTDINVDLNLLSLLNNVQDKTQITEEYVSQNNYSSTLLASSNLAQSSFTVGQVKESSSDSSNSQTEVIKKISLYFFLILFVPFGIFYPFFLFYKNLLKVDRVNRLQTSKSEKLEKTNKTSSFASITSLNSENLKSQDSTDNLQAIVSQLQIAFAVEDDSLKQQLVELCSSVDSRTDQGIAELMRKSISLLINNETKWTHISQSSQAFPLDLIKEKFEAIYVREKNKSLSEKLTVVGSNPDNPAESSAVANTKDSANYIVITLALCTAHTKTLFSEIRTKKKLLEQLSELAKMRQDDLIKFDLFWNPQADAQYLNNNELLVNYLDMVRLF